jgi:hypothetical protein
MIRQKMVGNTDREISIFAAVLFPKVIEPSLARGFPRRWSFY